MPVHKCPNGKFRIGSGKCQYDSKQAAEKAYKAYLAKKHSDSKNESQTKIDSLMKAIDKDLDDLYNVRSYLWSVKEVLQSDDFSEKYNKLREKVNRDLEKINNIDVS